jgi:hypothetical protein
VSSASIACLLLLLLLTQAAYSFEKKKWMAG